jgi:hypothetical protein
MVPDVPPHELVTTCLQGGRLKVRALVLLIPIVLGPLILAACGGGDSTGTNIGAPAIITKVGTDPAYVVAGASFADSVRVRVTDASNNSTSGQSVTFAVTAGGGSVTPGTVITDANGRAAAKFITAIKPGTNTATATVGSLTPVAFSITTVTAGTIVWSTTPMDTLRGIWGTSASDVWAVGYHGKVVHYNGTIWSSVSSATTEPLVGVWGTSPSNVWAVGGYNGTILHYDGTSWSSFLERGRPGIFFGVWGGSSSDVWAVGGIDSVLHYSGTAWSNSARVTPTIYGIWGSSASDVWAVGYAGNVGGTIIHYNGTTWSSVPSGTTSGLSGLSGIWGSSASDVWATGDVGTILHYNGATWSSVASPTSQALPSVWGSSASDVWAVGYGGSIVHYDGTGWSNVPSGTTQTLFAVWGSSASDIWAVGTGGLVHGSAAR